jgi:hypothetical protein
MLKDIIVPSMIKLISIAKIINGGKIIINPIGKKTSYKMVLLFLIRILLPFLKVEQILVYLTFLVKEH